MPTSTPENENAPASRTDKAVVCDASGSTILWDDAGDLIRGYIDNPKTTLFIIERRTDKPHRGRMTGAVIPDEDEKPDGLLGNALISWLQGCAAPMYLREFEDRLLARRAALTAAQLDELIATAGPALPEDMAALKKRGNPFSSNGADQPRAAEKL